MSPLPDPKITAAEALAKRLETWKGKANAARSRPERELNKTCFIIGTRVSNQLQTTLMQNKYSPMWTKPILDWIEQQTKKLLARDGHHDDQTADLIAQLAASRFEACEFEERFRHHTKQFIRIGRLMEQLQGRS